MPEVHLGIRELCEFLLQCGDIDSRFTGFDRALEGARIHRRLQKEAGPNYQAEVPLKFCRSFDGIDYVLEGRADGIFPAPDGTLSIDEIKTTALPAEQITAKGTPCHWAQGKVYAAIYAQQHALPHMQVRLTYYQIDMEKAFHFTQSFLQEELTAFLEELLHAYTPWAKRKLEHTAARGASLEQLSFPFSTWRAGQHAMAGEVYRTFQTEGGRLFCQAPTGIGKTMSALFPAIKAIGDGFGDKIFYLTARSTAAGAAQQALTLLQQQAPVPPAVRSIVLTAKEKVCLCLNESGRAECLPERCPYARGYYDRLLTALQAALEQESFLSREALAGLARQYQVCPFELGLDLSAWCDVIIGDYNYLFDPVVQLRRFFETHGDWLFLIDEAHNLPDRARDMYSASFSKSTLLDARRALGKGKSHLKTALAKANSLLLEYRRACSGPSAEEPSPDDNACQTSFLPAIPDEASSADTAPPVGRSLFGTAEPLLQKRGTRFYAALPEPLLHALRAILVPAQAWLEEHRDGEAHEAILQMYFSLRDFLRTAENYSDCYVTQFSAGSAELTVSLLCLDPSAFVSQCLAAGRAAVFFSATLAPPGYYREILGCPEARAVSLPSPFPQENLNLCCLCSVSTRYRDRADSLVSIADTLAEMVRTQAGNYLAFFPSYSYLQQVQEIFCQQHPDISVLVQRSGLDEAARAEFLSHFRSAQNASLLGFCVMGGVFGEGIDLTGQQLIGCAVVGVGLPQVSPRQEILRQYYDRRAGCGFDFAYRFPGMNKVLQAAGRVIRTAQDRGVVLLIDDRFSQPQYQRLFPAHWANLRYFSDTASLQSALRAFWQ